MYGKMTSEELGERMTDVLVKQKLTEGEIKAFNDQLYRVKQERNKIQDEITRRERVRLSGLPVTDDHRKLMREMEFRLFDDGGGCVLIGVEGKRPFGESYVYSSVGRILGWVKEGEDMSDEQVSRAIQIIRELPYAINKVLREGETERELAMRLRIESLERDIRTLEVSSDPFRSLLGTRGGKGEYN